MTKENLIASNLSEVFFNRFFSDWKDLSVGDFLDYLGSKMDQLITFTELEKKINSGKKLSIKFGIDPTGPDVHLGHLLPIFVLRQFQKAGHQIHLIIGDFTAMIGDPSGRNDQRPPLSESDVKKNAKTYFDQIEKYLSLSKVKKHFNSKWLNKLSFEDILRDLQKMNLSEVLQREDFRSRLKEGHSLMVSELLYSYAQGIDSVELNPDIEIGGRDQLLNFAQGRTIMQIRGQEPEVAFTTPVLEGIAGDGRKMSKSYGNYIAVNSSVEDKFGKLMSIPDNLLEMYFKAFADIKESELNHLQNLIAQDPFEVKKQLAQFFVSVEEKSLEAGLREREKFENRFSKGVYDNQIEVLTAKNGSTFFDVIAGFGVIQSKSELHRLFSQESIKMVKPEEKIIKEEDLVSNCIIKIGKTKFFKIEIFEK